MEESFLEPIPCKKMKRRREEWRDLNSPFVQKFIVMKKGGATFQEIGKAIGVNRQRAHQLAQKMQSLHGDTIFQESVSVFTPQEVAQELKISVTLVRRLCASGLVTAQQKNGRWLLSTESIEAIKRHPLASGERRCVVCKKIFYLKKGTHERYICYLPDCLAFYHEMRRAGYGIRDPKKSNLRGWRKRLFQALKKHRVPEDEIWITLSEVRKKTGLSKMQVQWLKFRGILRVKDDPSRTRLGQPFQLYALSEIEIVARIVKETNDTGK